VISVPGLVEPDAGDILQLEPAALRQMSLESLLQMMRRCGLTTAGIEQEGAAIKQLVERVALSSE